MQSIDGGIVKSRSQPYADISVQYYCLRAFLAFGSPLQAKKILDFIMKKFILHNDINAFECVGGDIYRQSAGTGHAATPAYCILMVFEYFKFSGDKDYLVTLLPMLKYAIRIQIKNACGDLMVSDGCESAILNGYITNKVAYADSMRNTLLYIESLKAMLYIIDALSCKIINRAVIDKAVQRSIIAFSETFIDNGFRSYAGRSRKIHRERFRYGICDSCGDKIYPRIIAFLERCDDEYLCRSCYNKIPFLITETDPSVFDKTIISDILLIPYLNSNIVDIKTIVKFIEIHKNKETNFLPVIIGSDKYIHSDTGMFLYILSESGNTDSELLFKSLIDASCINDLWNEHKGSGEYTVYTNAICAEALMKYLKNTNIL